MHRGHLFRLILLACAVLVAGGCGDDGNGPKPVISVEVTPHSTTVEIAQTASIEAEVSGGSDDALDWFVNDVCGGNSVVGTITQTNCQERFDLSFFRRSNLSPF
jgi:hypothetical protein